jgi:hypothetical protein
MSYLCYLCLFVFSGVQHMLCYVFVLFFSSCTLWCQFLWIVLYPMVPVSLDCLVPYGASFSGLSCTLWCQFLWIVLYPMVPVSLDCLVLYGASFSGLSIFDCPFSIL